ncbi:hypothetical protein BKA67DRAFT_654427 [Truncatella angustata]|uniref:DUF155 domain-containing protein n=1 Tax=Truncatella angustata TaxID=152316 RepID=A0A9P9A305_9PEZI|nr:uncharacterized protein BKA67DRAFT_654427 [Truncatella angustata]KAH6661306.1 hypothetical protein BKA67DRAFT_654427 [Truncatella angustata]KAH8197736.1 hypothetical protein TruAng_008114 [Truncatella angustata]
MASSGASSSTATGSNLERTPLLHDGERPRATRNVTFNPDPVSSTYFPEPASLASSPGSTLGTIPTTNPLSPVGTTGSIPNPAGSAAAHSSTISAMTSRLRRRNSHGATFSTLPAPLGPLPKLGPQRSSKTAQKLKLLPNPDTGEGMPDEESGRDVYSQYTRIQDPVARRDAARLGKADRDRLPRVTAYCTANNYQMEALLRFLKGRGKTRSANPKLIDECIYTPYNYSTGKGAERAETVEERTRRERGEQERREREASGESTQMPVQNYERRHSTGQLIDVGDGAADVGTVETYDSGRDFHNNLSYPSQHDEIHDPSSTQHEADFDTTVHVPEVFLFEYGVVVIWGMTLAHEKRFLKDIAKFENEKLDDDDVETECFNFYYTREYQARIYNDFITLRDKTNYMTKLAISHALAQSVKTSLFEELIASTIETCKDIPTQIALTGKIALTRSQINMQIGELFILRINIHLNGSVLDTPELFWVEPALEPLYQAVRAYLEMDQRVGLLTERLDVIADLLAVLKDQLSHGHGEMLEWIVIILIAAEILVAAVNIVVDLYAGVD